MKRQRVWQVAAWYGSVALATALAVSELWEPLGLPAGAPRLVILVLATGFPAALVVAWAYERRLGNGPDTAGSSGEARADGRRSIVVLPFENMSPDPGDAYFSDGLTEEVITDLSSIRSLRVISRSSAMRLKGSSIAAFKVGRDLGVDFVLEGAVRKAGNDLRINVRLVDVASDEPRWNQQYRGTFDDIFEIQEQVARAVTEELAIQVSRDEVEALADRRSEDPRALESYLRARYEIWQFSRTGIENAERHLKNGLAVVGESALLYASLGHAYTWYAQLGLDPEGLYLQRAEECVEKVFSLEPDSPRGQWLQGLVRFHAGELRSARAPLERALKGLPDDPDTLMMLGYLSALSGQHERAVLLFQRCLLVDPLTPLNHAVCGFVDVMEGRPEDALEGYRTYLDMDPESPFAAWCWAWILLRNQRAAEARPVIRALVERHPDSLFAGLAEALLQGVAGDGMSGRDVIFDGLREAAERSELFSRELTHCLALAGETDEALHWLENTIRIGNVNYPFWSRHDRWLDNIRAEPRFVELMTQVEREWQALNPELAT